MLTQTDNTERKGQLASKIGVSPDEMTQEHVLAAGAAGNLSAEEQAELLSLISAIASDTDDDDGDDDGDAGDIGNDEDITD